MAKEKIKNKIVRVLALGGGLATPRAKTLLFFSFFFLFGHWG
jgi:hypothetical protein